MSSGVAELDIPPLHQAPAVGCIQLHFPLKNLALGLAEDKEKTPGFCLCSVSSSPHFAVHGRGTPSDVLVVAVQCSGLFIEGFPPKTHGKILDNSFDFEGEERVGHGVIDLLLWEFG